jgi:hypothetical protein
MLNARVDIQVAKLRIASIKRKTTILWDVTLFSMVDRYHDFIGLVYPYQEDSKLVSRLYVPNCMMSHPKRQF